MYKFVQYEVSMPIHVGSISHQRKLPILLLFKFLCLILSLGEVCTYADVDTNDTDADDARQGKHDCVRLFG